MAILLRNSESNLQNEVSYKKRTKINEKCTETAFLSKIKDFYLSTKIFCKHSCCNVFQQFQ